MCWAGMWRGLAIGLDGARIICVFEGGDLGGGTENEREKKTRSKK